MIFYVCVGLCLATHFLRVCCANKQLPSKYGYSCLQSTWPPVPSFFSFSPPCPGSCLLCHLSHPLLLATLCNFLGRALVNFCIVKSSSSIRLLLNNCLIAIFIQLIYRENIYATVFCSKLLMSDPYGRLLLTIQCLCQFILSP